jgi:hypothetical protein
MSDEAKTVLTTIVVIALVAWGFIAMFSLFGDLGKMKYRIYDGESSYYTNEYKESNGCISFTSYTKTNVKLCGYYTLKEQ